MASTVKVPELGENVDSVDVVRILVAVGDHVSVEQPLIEVETEKASVEIPSDVAGAITEIHVTEGDSLRAGAPIATIEDSEQPETTADRTAPQETPEVSDRAPAQSTANAQAEVADRPAPQPARASAPPRSSAPAAGNAAGSGTTATMVGPELGEDVEAVDVVAVLVEAGQELAIDQPVIEVETEKASVEVPSTVSGTVTVVHASEGDTLRTGDPIVTVSQDEAETSEAEPAAAPEPETGDRPASEDRSPEPTPSAAERRPPQAEGTQLAPRWRAPEDTRTLVPAAPTVRRFAREVGVDITEVRGSGPGGRISIDDIKAFTARRLSQAADSPVGTASPELPDLSAWGEVRREPMSKVRQATARNMARAWVTVPQVTHHDQADITALEALRTRYRGRVEAAGGKLTVTSILVKIVASALKVFPTLNAAVDAARQEIVYRERVHIGVAVDTERGLLVPVIRDADRKNITTISVELDDLAQRARDRKLAPDEMQGGGFSISNLGGIGGTSFTPIVNWPEVAILGVSRAATLPRWTGEAFEPRLMLPLSLSYDHRLVDGADAARFLRWVAEAVEEPLLLALEG